MVKCVNDDSASCCGICDMSPIVLIATHKRIEITTKNIELLKKQTKVPRIVIVATDREERRHYKELGVEVVNSPNEPLGRKWQSGVSSDANPLIICGSDDILASDYVERVCRLVAEGYDMIGVTSWYVHDTKRNDTWQASYINKCENFPLGAGKAISGRLLKDMKYQVFSTHLKKNLDNSSYNHAIMKMAKIKRIRTPEVLSVKGDWHTLNPIDKLITGKNIHMTAVDFSNLKKFGYV